MARLFDDASSQYLESDTALVADVPLTIAAWIYTDDIATADDQGIVFIGDKDVSDHHFFLRYDATEVGDPIIARQRSVGSSGVATAGTVTANTWIHAAAVFVNDASRYAYFNGTPGSEDTTSVTGAMDVDRITVGRLGDSSADAYFSGRIAEVGVWNVALTAAEISALAKGYSPLFVRPENLVFYLPLIRDDDEDLIGGVSLTAYNSPTIAAHPPVLYPISAQHPSPASGATTSTSSSTSTSTTSSSSSTSTTSSSSSTSTSTTSSSSSTSTSTTTTLNPATGGLAFGEQNPVGETPVSWATWSDGAGGAPTIIGDADWGKLELDITEEGRSLVYDFGDETSRTLTVTEDKYGAGQGTATIQIRGQAAAFDQDDGEPPNWENYVAPVGRTWRYIQVRAIKNS